MEEGRQEVGSVVDKPKDCKGEDEEEESDVEEEDC